MPRLPLPVYVSRPLQIAEPGLVASCPASLLEPGSNYAWLGQILFEVGFLSVPLSDSPCVEPSCRAVQGPSKKRFLKQDGVLTLRGNVGREFPRKPSRSLLAVAGLEVAMLQISTQAQHGALQCLHFLGTKWSRYL
jgi:hypothetical protein